MDQRDRDFLVTNWKFIHKFCTELELSGREKQRNKSTTKYVIVLLLQENVSVARILLLVERLVGESQWEITELSVAGAALEMELIDVLVQSRHVTELNLTNGAVRDKGGGPWAQATPPVSKLFLRGTVDPADLHCCVSSGQSFCNFLKFIF